MKIQLSKQGAPSGPDFSSLIPGDVSQPQGPAVHMDDLDSDEADAIPNEGTANVGYKVAHRTKETKVDKDGKETHKHHIRLHLQHFEPDENGKKPKSKKLMDNTDAQQAVRDHFEP